MDSKVLSEYLHKYTVHILYGLGALILFLGLYTQLPTLLTNIGEVSALESQNADLDQSLASLQGRGNTNLDTQLNIVNTALPSEKDASLIYSTITSAAAKHAIGIDNFSVDVGEVYVSDGTEGVRDDTSAPLKVQLDVTSPSFVNMKQFVAELYKSLPVSEVENLSISEGKGTLVLNFFYKPAVTGIAPGVIQPVSSAEQQTYNEISTWARPN